MIDCLKQQIGQCRVALAELEERLDEVVDPGVLALPRSAALLGQLQLKIAELLRKRSWWGWLKLVAPPANGSVRFEEPEDC